MSNDKSFRLNNEITARQLRLVGEKGEQLGIVSLEEAMQAAEKADLDLVEIAPRAVPPVCRLMDYRKFLFEQNKQKQVAKKKQKQIDTKEVKIRPATEEADYQVKLRNLIRFLTNGDKAKITLRFRGRELAHMELGEQLMKRIQLDLEPYGIIEQVPKLEGRQMVMVFGPKKLKAAV